MTNKLIPSSKGIPDDVGYNTQQVQQRIKYIIVAVGIIILVGVVTLLIWVNDPDNKPNKITDFKIVETDKTSAVVSWITTKPSDSKVKYCPPSGLCLFTEPDTNRVTLHVMHIKNFTPNTKYEMAIISVDKIGKETIAEFEFYKKGD